MQQMCMRMMAAGLGPRLYHMNAPSTRDLICVTHHPNLTLEAAAGQQHPEP